MREIQRPMQKRARELRRDLTQFERDAWKILRAMGEMRFRRQVAWGPYILDFYSPRYRLCVELDGPLHQRERDELRDRRLALFGIETIRFNDSSVSGLERVIHEACGRKKPRY